MYFMLNRSVTDEVSGVALTMNRLFVRLAENLNKRQLQKSSELYIYLEQELQSFWPMRKAGPYAGFFHRGGAVRPICRKSPKYPENN